MLQKLLIIAWACASLLLSGCGLVYRIDVQQGNIVTQDMLDKLQIGMSSDKVRYVMGTPLLLDVFHQRPQQQRWDYYYSVQQGWAEPERKLITLIIEDDRLQAVEGGVSIGRQADPQTAPRDSGEPIL